MTDEEYLRKRIATTKFIIKFVEAEPPSLGQKCELDSLRKTLDNLNTNLNKLVDKSS